ncbi:MAG: hypothetical protein SO073_06865, partial [Candidatus Onthomonas sp.]|nr:hypothetical protein [Candidatus Onthomonas sp.]
MSLGPAIFLIILACVIAALLLVHLTKKKFFYGLLAVICVVSIIACGMANREKQKKLAVQTGTPVVTQPSDTQTGDSGTTQFQDPSETTDSGQSSIGTVTGDSSPSANNNQASGTLSEGRQAADTCMNETYGNWTYTFQSANEGYTNQQYYTYKVSKASDILTESFDTVVRYEPTYHNAAITQGNIVDMYDPRSPTWDDLTTRIWNLAGTWVYRDCQRDFTVTVSNVTGETVTLQYSLSGYDLSGTLMNDPGQSLSSTGSVQAQIQPYLGVDDNRWYVRP